MSAYDKFNEYIGRINDLCCTANLLLWDERTQMPSNGGLNRGSQFSTVLRLAQEKFTDNEMGILIDRAEAELQLEDSDSYPLRNVKRAREAFEISRKVPLDIISRQGELISVAQEAWSEAREMADFKIFLPFLEKMIGIKRELAESIGYGDHPYDALLHRYEPGLTGAGLNRLFEDIQNQFLPLIKVAKDVKEPRYDFLYRKFPVQKQKEFASRVVRAFGYDFSQGRIDSTVHPFEISFTREDVRITTRYNENFLPMAMFGLFHEAGHGIYEQCADPVLSRTALTTDLHAMYAVGGVSFGMHESQSRLWENLVGRSRGFWSYYYPILKDTFPEALGDVDEEEFYI